MLAITLAATGLVGGCAGGAAIGVAAAASDPPAPAGSALVSRLRHQLAAERTAHRRDVRVLRRELTHRPSVRHAIRLAGAAYRRDPDRMSRVARCESHLDPAASNGSYLGLYQFGTPLWARTPFRTFDRTDPYAAAMAAAWAFSKGLDRNWPVCGR
jgi:hypothetical protein